MNRCQPIWHSIGSLTRCLLCGRSRTGATVNLTSGANLKHITSSHLTGMSGQASHIDGKQQIPNFPKKVMWPSPRCPVAEDLQIMFHGLCCITLGPLQNFFCLAQPASGGFRRQRGHTCPNEGLAYFIGIGVLLAFMFQGGYFNSVTLKSRSIVLLQS